MVLRSITAGMFLLLVQSAVGGIVVCDDLDLESSTEGVIFEQQVQPIFESHCIECHSAGHFTGLDLQAGASYELLVDVESSQDGNWLRIDSSSLTNSLLFQKINCNDPPVGDRMPLNGPPYLTLSEQALIRDWIEQGAINLIFASRFELQSGSSPDEVIEVSGNDDCDTAVSVPPAGGIFRGDTSTLTNTYTTTMCGAGSFSPDAAFKLDLTETRQVIADLSGSAFDTILHVHSGACASEGEIFCDDTSGTGFTSRIDQELTAGTWYFIVDGWGGSSSGEYTIQFTLTEP